MGFFIRNILQVCRLAYELMQARLTDASNRFISLDDVYYYGGGVGLVQTVESAHDPRNPTELQLSVGDKIGVAGNHWNGMSKGTNQRTRKVSSPMYNCVIFVFIFPNPHHMLTKCFFTLGWIISIL